MMRNSDYMRRLALRLCLALVFVSIASGADCAGDDPQLPDDPAANSNSPPDDEPPGDDPPDDDPPLTCEPPCGFGLVCQDGACTPVNVPQCQLGYTDEATDEYSATPDGATMPLFTFGQGGGHMFVTIRVAGLTVPSDGTLEVDYEITRPEDSTVLSEFNQLTHFSSLDGGIFEASRRVIFLNDFPELLHGDTIRCTFVIASPEDVGQTVSIDQTLVLDFRP
jgi:hypothetical protein